MVKTLFHSSRLPIVIKIDTKEDGPFKEENSRPQKRIHQRF